MNPIYSVFQSIETLRTNPRIQSQAPAFSPHAVLNCEVTYAPSDFPDFLEWERDILRYGKTWPLSAMPRVKAKPILIDYIAHKNPYKLARDNFFDKNVMTSCVKVYGLSLKLAASGLKNDKQLVLAAVKERAASVRFASSELKNDPEVIDAALAQDGLSLVLLSESVKADLGSVKKACTQNALALKYASFELRDHKELVMLAVSQNGYALQFASIRLKTDKEVVKAALLCPKTPDEILTTVQEKTPNSEISGLLTFIRQSQKADDIMFLEKMQFVDFFNHVVTTPLDYADESLKSDLELLSLHESTLKTLETLGVIEPVFAAKRARLNFSQAKITKVADEVGHSHSGGSGIPLAPKLLDITNQLGSGNYTFRLEPFTAKAPGSSPPGSKQSLPANKSDI